MIPATCGVSGALNPLLGQEPYNLLRQIRTPWSRILIFVAFLPRIATSQIMPAVAFCWWTVRFGERKSSMKRVHRRTLFSCQQADKGFWLVKRNLLDLAGWIEGTERSGNQLCAFVFNPLPFPCLSWTEWFARYQPNNDTVQTMTWYARRAWGVTRCDNVMGRTMKSSMTGNASTEKSDNAHVKPRFQSRKRMKQQQLTGKIGPLQGRGTAKSLQPKPEAQAVGSTTP